MITPSHPLRFGLLKVSGQEAKKLLQGQLTCDVEEANAERGLLGAHCNPKGRILSLFYLVHLEDAYYLWMPQELISIAMAALKKYSVFYKAELMSASDDSQKMQAVQTILNKQLANPAHSSLHYRLLCTGVPAIYPATSGKFLPHDIHLHHLKGVNFTKGCYTGQEIIARMEYKATRKKQCYHTQLSNSSAPQPGDIIFSQENGENLPRGEVVDVYSHAPHQHDALIIADSNHAQESHLFLQEDSYFFTFSLTSRENT